MISDIAGLAETYDVIVLGTGAAGLSAAVFSALKGRSTLLLERTELVGGTSALSAATTWIPNSDHAASVNPDDNRDAAEHFLAQVVGNHGDRAMHRAFLEAGPRAIRTLEAGTQVRFRPYATHPDYEQHHEGATLRGRALEPLPFDGRVLGPALDLIRPPIPEFTLFGGMMVDRTDIGHLLKLRSSLASLRHGLGILGRYGLDRLQGRRRGSRLVMGNALIGRLLASYRDLGGRLAVSVETTAFTREGQRVTGITIRQGALRRTITARQAVVLAGGGFGRNPALREAFLPAELAPFSPAAPGHTGALQQLALDLGARYGADALDHAFWAPVSTRKRADGTIAVFPHFVLDRSKPGTICVNQQGERFTNESASYHLFARAMIEAHGRSPTVPCWIIADAPALQAYGLGMVRMGTRNLQPFLDDGYLIAGATLDDLADRLGMPATTLRTTVERFNRFARAGTDEDFGRGTTAYHRVNGDPASGMPNPTMRPLEAGPFYAVKLWPGDIGAATGLAISPDAEVLGRDNQPLQGLYACGNEAQSIMGGTYPGPGITIGPAITFAFRAIEHAMQTQPERAA